MQRRTCQNKGQVNEREERSNTVMVMPANNTGAWVGYLAGKYEGRIGHLYSPGAELKRRLPFIPFALDNKRYVCWMKNEPWDEVAYFRMLASHGADAMWCIVPDVVGNRDGTLRGWDKYAPRMQRDGLTLAMAVQDGMTAADVPKEAEVVCTGGTTEWKHKTLYYWAENFRRNHVLRINTEKWLWECLAAGVESCDGTGWFRGDPVQFRGLLRFLDRSSRGIGPRERTLFDKSSCGRDSLSETSAAIQPALRLGRGGLDTGESRGTHPPMDESREGREGTQRDCA